MISFNEFLNEQLTDQEIDTLVEEVSWDDISDLYTDDEFEDDLDESLSVNARLKKGQKMKSRKTAIAQSRRMKLRRSSNPQVLGKRAKLAARRAVMKKLLKGRDKHNLSAQEKDRIEKQASVIMANQKGLVAKMLPKVRTLERQRLSPKK